MVTNDKLVCYKCTEQPCFLTIYDFIAHKVSKTCYTSNDEDCTNSTRNHKCQLCPQKFSRKSSLLLHYTLYHRVHGINKSSCCNDNITRSLKRNNSVTPCLTTKRPSRSKSSVTTILKSDPVVIPDGAREKELEGGVHNDFYMMLQDEEIAGSSSLRYTKRWLSCIYCIYRCTVISELATHMQVTHTDIFRLHIEKQPKPSGTEGIIRMSEYLQQTGSLLVLPRPKSPATVEPGGVASFRCEFCHKHFTNKTYLRRHRENQHIKPKIYQCDLCNHVETVKHKLKSHREKHLTKEFRCKECDFVSTVNVAIQSHRQLHRTGSYICDICSKAYKLKDTLEKHKRVHDKSRPYACTFDGCMLRFKTERMCRGHLKTHFGDTNTFPCSECGYSFRQKHHLKRHLENTHSMTFARVNSSTVVSKLPETFGIPASPPACDVMKPSMSNSESSSFNLRDIIIEGERFQLSTAHNEGEQANTTSIILLKPNNKSLLYQPANSALAQSMYDSRHSGQLTPVYVSNRDTDTTEEVATSVDDSNTAALLEHTVTTPYCLEESCEQTIPTNQASAVVEFIVDSNTDGVIFDGPREEETADSLFN